MFKIRSMVAGADKSGVDSTSSSDPRITPIGKFIRKAKLDEFSQLWNVFIGNMSLVGPRPQVQRDVNLYTENERNLLNVRPGITDFSSIVFADEADILRDMPDPDLTYNQIIRPWKSRMGLHYIKSRTFWNDIQLLLATITNMVSRKKALAWISRMLANTGADEELVEIARREKSLRAAPPPGSKHIVTSRV